jgi:hypothetical protein
MFNSNRTLNLSLAITPIRKPLYQFYKTLSIVKSSDCPDKGEVFVRYKTIEGEVKKLTIVD